MTSGSNARVLVAAASKHGATAEIADRIGATLEERGMEVTVASAEQVTGIEDYQALILGSAVYAGHWLDAARQLADRIAGSPGSPPVWLFSSGPIGDPPRPEEDPVDVADIYEKTSAREHRVFAGKIDRSRLSFGEKAIMIAVRASDGDFREWEEIAGWASEIADTLAAERGPT